MVDWIAAPTPPKDVQKPVMKRPVPRPQPAPLVSRAPEPSPPPEPLPFVAAAPAPEAPVPVVPPSPPAPAPAPVELTPPAFNADYLQNPAPAYPAQSRRLGEQGRVILRVLVGSAGSAQEVQVRTSSGYPRLDEAARETVKQWKFHPARRGAEAVAAWVLVPIHFSLDN